MWTGFLINRPMLLNICTELLYHLPTPVYVIKYMYRMIASPSHSFKNKIVNDSKAIGRVSKDIFVFGNNKGFRNELKWLYLTNSKHS